MNLNINNDVAGVGNYPSYAPAAEYQNNETNAVDPVIAVEDGVNKNEAAIYEQSAEKTYKPDLAKVKQIWADFDVKVENFRKLVEALLNKQTQKYDLATDWYRMSKADWEKLIADDVDGELRAAAQKEVEEGGYFSVEETAKRLLDFAVALSGGDPSKIDLLRDAVQKGYKDAERQWGGELPEITQKTLEAVMKGFDEWAENGNVADISLLKKE